MPSVTVCYTATNKPYILITSPMAGVQSIVISMCVCLSVVRVFVCLSTHISKNHTSKLHQIFCTCYLWPWLGLPLTAMRCVLYLRICGWHHVSM